MPKNDHTYQPMKLSETDSRTLANLLREDGNFDYVQLTEAAKGSPLTDFERVVAEKIVEVTEAHFGVVTTPAKGDALGGAIINVVIASSEIEVTAGKSEDEHVEAHNVPSGMPRELAELLGLVPRAA